MNDSTVLQRNPQAVSAEVGEEIIFLHEGDGVYYSLDGVGAFVWKNLEIPRTLGDLVRAVGDAYDVGEAEAREDLAALAIELAARGLLVPDPQ
jgi:hypothetical protein